MLDTLENPDARFVLTIHSKPKAVLIGAEAFLNMLRGPSPEDRLLALAARCLRPGPRIVERFGRRPTSRKKNWSESERSRVASASASCRVDSVPGAGRRFWTGPIVADGSAHGRTIVDPWPGPVEPVGMRRSPPPAVPIGRSAGERDPARSRSTATGLDVRPPVIGRLARSRPAKSRPAGSCVGGSPRRRRTVGRASRRLW